MSRSRIPPPCTRDGATDFSDDPELADPIRLMAMAARQPAVKRLIQHTTVSFPGPHRQRLPGHWVLIYIAFVTSRIIDVQPWYLRSTEEQWRAAGFHGKPSYTTVQRRFVELEQFADKLDFSAGEFFGIAAEHEPRARDHVIFDSTEAETHAALVHDCEPHECPDLGRYSTGRRAPKRMQRETTDRHRRKRHLEAEAADPAELPDSTSPASSDVIERRQLIEDETGKRYVRVLIDGHWFRCSDPDAGVRAYTGPFGSYRFWVGYYNQKGACLCFGCPTAVTVAGAHTQEYHIYPQTLERVEARLGGPPVSAIFDRGFAVGSVYELNTRKGIATIAPQREHHKRDTPIRDRDGVPRCFHCGGETVFVDFRHLPTPRLWLQCSTPQTAECQPIQTIACSLDWPHLVPVWRTHLRYWQLKVASALMERIHHHWRIRYGVAGDNSATRPKRRGIGVQNLRAQAALMIEWLCICWRHGWLPGTRNRNPHDTGPLRVKADADPDEKLQALLDERHEKKLHLSYTTLAARHAARRRE